MAPNKDNIFNAFIDIKLVTYSMNMPKKSIIYLNRTEPLNCPDCNVTYKFEVIVENE